jgi:hypothetical protein
MLPGGVLMVWIIAVASMTARKQKKMSWVLTLDWCCSISDSLAHGLAMPSKDSLKLPARLGCTQHYTPFRNTNKMDFQSFTLTIM